MKAKGQERVPADFNSPAMQFQPALTKDRLSKWLEHYANRWIVTENRKTAMIDIAVDVPLATSSIALIEGGRRMGTLIQVRTLMPWEARLKPRQWRIV